jgi:CrcB protein
MVKVIYLVMGGAAGTVARYVLSGATYQVLGANFPYGTFAVNLIGCFIVGFLASLTEKNFLLSADLRLLLMVGFCGAFTTFSTFLLETASLVMDGEMGTAVLNVILSIVLGFILLYVGILLGKLI